MSLVNAFSVALQGYLPQTWTHFTSSTTPSLDTVSFSRPPLCVPAVSCSLQSVPNLDGCCINDPSGHFLATQFWDPSPPLGGNETWTIHGLWPDFCHGGFDMYCNNTRSKSPEEITRILSQASTPEIQGGTHPGLLHYMMTHWLSLDSRNANLWAHEWSKHGTCISTLEPQCYDRDRSVLDPAEDVADGDVLDYFTHAVLLYTTLPTFDFLARHGIVPSHERTYELEHLQRAIKQSQHSAHAIFRCRNHNELSEIWYSYHARGSLRDAMDAWWDGNRQWNSWVPTDPQGQTSNCPAKGIRYVPKEDRKHDPPHTATSITQTSTQTATTTASGTSEPSSRPFTGKGRLMVKVVSDPSSTPRNADATSLHGNHRSLAAKAEDGVTTAPIPSPYTGCLIRRGTWYASRSLSSCATFTAHTDIGTFEDEIRALIQTPADPDEEYHLFTLSSRFAPCSFVRPEEISIHANDLIDNDSGFDASRTANARMFFECDKDLTFQSILSNSAKADEQHTEKAKRLTLGVEHQYTFYAEQVPRRAEQVNLWTNDGEGKRGVKVEIYWENV